MVLRFPILVEPDVARLSRLALEAAQASGGSVFRAARALAAVTDTLRAARAATPAALEVRLIVGGAWLRLDFAGRSQALTPVAANAPGHYEALAARLDGESRSRDPELLLQQNREATRIAEAQAEALATLERSLEEKRRELAVLAREADRDPLTGLYNRRAYDTHLMEAIAGARAGNRPLALMFLDLDRFKEVNDSEGHAAGDRYLKGVAAVLEAAVRGGEDYACRTGGDEFALIVSAPRARALAIARQIVERLLQGVSIGLALWRAPEDAEQLAKRADEALYRAKNAGRGRVVAAD